MSEPTDAEKILLKVVDLQAKHMDNPLSMFLYQIDTKELMDAQAQAYRESVRWDEDASPVQGFRDGWAACWQALCKIAETQEKMPTPPTFNHTREDGPMSPCPICLEQLNACLDADLAKLREEWTEI